MKLLDKSRYVAVPVITARREDGTVVNAMKLRRLPRPPAAAVTVGDGERLDVMAYRRYGDATRFWHIADANDALEARTLAARGNVILVPER